MKFQASTLDNRNVGSKIAIPKKESIIYGEVASIEQKVAERKTVIALTDGFDPHEIDHDVWLDVQLSAAENAVIQSSTHIQTLIRLVETVINNQEK